MWLLYASLTAVLHSLAASAGKGALKEIAPIVVLAWTSTVSCLAALAAWAIFDGTAYTHPQFLLPAVCSIVIGYVANRFYYAGLKRTALTIALPLLNLSPVWLIWAAPLIAGDEHSGWGIAGILTSVAGVYTVQLSKRKAGLLAPFTAIVKESGSRMILVTSFLWAISSAYDRLAVLNSSPLWYYSVAAGGIAILAWISIFISKEPALRPTKLIVTNGILGGAATMLQMIAVSLVPVAYVISVKRTSAVFGILWGRIFFKEDQLGERLVGALLTVLGVAMLSLG